MPLTETEATRLRAYLFSIPIRHDVSEPRERRLEMLDYMASITASSDTPPAAPSPTRDRTDRWDDGLG